MRDRVALTLAAATAAVHLAVAGRYDVFRDELYFIVCGRHPSFGYADQPPLVPLLAAGSYALGAHTWLVRLGAVVAAAALVWVVVAFVRLLGGGDAAAWIGGLAAAIAPVLMGLTATLATTTFEPLAWTLVAYGLARAALVNDTRSLLWTGLVAGLAMEAKYALPLWLAALALGLATTSQRTLLRRGNLWLGVGLAAVIAAPSVAWQALHGWPFVELVHNAGAKDVATPPLAFALNQIVVLNPLLAPLWIAGLAAPFASRELRPLRFVSVAWVLTALAIVAGHGKDYYLAPAYPPLFALGAVAYERAVRNIVARVAYPAAALALTAVVAPVALPILPPPALVVYQRALHLTPQQQERGDAADVLPAWFADMLGWHDFVREVGSAYDALPDSERSRTSILVDNYGEAAALDVYGFAYQLPPALSGHNQYFFWGLRGQHPANLLTVVNDVAQLRPYCDSVHVVGETRSRYARDFENGRAIAVCLGQHPPLASLWPQLKVFI